MKPDLSVRLREVASLFFRLGVFAFGGPAAHIAMMRREVVTVRRWTSDAEFLDMVGATSLIPGPNSTEMAMHLGSRRAGWRGLVVAGALFILPAAAMVAGLAYAYVRFGSTPAVDWVLYGVKPVVIAIVVGAIWALGRVALRRPVSWMPAAGAVALYLLGVNEVFLVLGAGVLGVAAWAARRAVKSGGQALAVLPWLPLAGVPAMGTQLEGVSGYGAGTLFLSFLKIGAVLYGSGYVLLAFLRGDFVERLGWITEQQLLDAVAVGQVTPGTGIYDRDLHRLRGRRAAGGGTGDRGHISAVIRVCCIAFPHPSVCKGVGPRAVSSGLDQCGIPRPDGSGDISTRPGLHHRSLHDRYLGGRNCGGVPNQGQRRLAGAGRGRRRCAVPAGVRWLVVRTIRIGHRFDGPYFRLSPD